MNVIGKISALAACSLIDCYSITERITCNQKGFIHDTSIIIFAWLGRIGHIHFNNHTKIIDALKGLNNMPTTNGLNICCITWNI